MNNKIGTICDRFETKFVVKGKFTAQQLSRCLKTKFNSTRIVERFSDYWLVQVCEY